METLTTIPVIGHRQQLTVAVKYNSDDHCHTFLSGKAAQFLPWKLYLKQFQPSYHRHFEVLRTEVVARGLTGLTPIEMAQRNISFKFSDDEHWDFSIQSWQYFIYAVLNHTNYEHLLANSAA